MRRLRAEAGMTLIEMMLGATLTLLVVGGTLQTLDVFGSATARTGRLTDAVDGARHASQALARELRDATAIGGAAGSPQPAIVRAGASDLVFRAVDPRGTVTASDRHGLRVVRYCLDQGRRVLYRQWLAATATAPAACPGPGTATPVATAVANGSRPVFTYDAERTEVRVSLHIDEAPDRRPPEVGVVTGVYLRNSNRPPVASFTATATPGRHVLLNGSASSDPDAEGLRYTWRDGSTTLGSTSPVVDWVAPATGPRAITLVVEDPSGRTASETRVVQVQ